jgi:Exonuclease/UvrD-like helicase C-terminal domain
VDHVSNPTLGVHPLAQSRCHGLVLRIVNLNATKSGRFGTVPNEESAWLVEDLKQDQLESELTWGNYAVLYRTHKDGELIEQALVASGIPCQMGKGRSLTDDPMIDQLVAALRVVIAPDSWVEVERLAKSALGEVLLTEIKRRPGETLLSQARAYALNTEGENRSKAWRFVYQVENLRSLSQNQNTLQGVVDTILGQGLGRYESSLEKRHDQLSDPMMLAEASKLGRLLLEAESAGLTVFIMPSLGLEIPVREMIRQTLPHIRLDYYRPGAAKLGDLVIDLTGTQVGFPPNVQVFRPSDPERLKITQVFKALQCVESLRSGRFFEEYICFDTETTGKDTEYCDIIELAAVKVKHGKVVGEFHSLISTDQPISAGATGVHGYRDEDLLGQPRIAEVWPRFREFAGKMGLVVHNCHQTRKTGS